MRTRQDHAEERGQATVEFAVVLPLVALLILFVLQVVIIGRAQLVLQSAVREAARACAVNPGCNAPVIVSAHTDMAVDVEMSTGVDVRVWASAQVPIIVPGLRSSSGLNVTASATMRTETD
jgi:Flp pilus assembly pilin Flp